MPNYVSATIEIGKKILVQPIVLHNNTVELCLVYNTHFSNLDYSNHHNENDTLKKLTK